ncbi:hypothetical protein [Promineifilum sp.]|uniref:hypothetical protein n=1 Tax=Promineifilum sp. TaxID=2664178 RepID=UPI0035B232F1
MYENFGTTDVSPGTYHLYAYNYVSGTSCGQTPLYRDLGDHTFTTGKVTYVGLYPSWFPFLRPASGAGWDVQTYVRNHAATFRSATDVSYFNNTQVVDQWNQMVNSYASVLIDGEPTPSYSGLVAASQDSSAFELVKDGGQPAGTTSITAPTGRGSKGWEVAGPTLYVPLVKMNWVGRRTQIYVTNTGVKETTIDVKYYNTGGDFYPPPGNPQTLVLPPNVRKALDPWERIPVNGIYAAVISNVTGNSEPLAAVAKEEDSASPYDAPALYNAFSSGSTILYAPLVKKNYAGNTSGITLQNVGAVDATFRAYYYDMNGQPQGSTVSGTIERYAPYVLYNPPAIPNGFLGSVRIESTNNVPLVGEVSEEDADVADPRLISNLALRESGSQIIHLPLWYDNYTAAGGDWASGVNVRNIGTAETEVTIRWYNQSGAQVHLQTEDVNVNDTHNFYDPSALSNFIGSVMIQSSGQPIVATANIHNWIDSDVDDDGKDDYDTALAFNGSNR